MRDTVDVDLVSASAVEMRADRLAASLGALVLAANEIAVTFFATCCVLGALAEAPDAVLAALLAFGVAPGVGRALFAA